MKRADQRNLVADYYRRTGAPVHHALDNHLALIRWTKSEQGEESYGLIEEAAMHSGEAEFESIYHARLHGQFLARKIAQGLDSAQTIWVDRDMTDLIEAATLELPPGDALHETDLFQPAGFAQFARPIPFTWARDDDVEMLGATRDEDITHELAAICWFPSIVTISQADDDPDGVSRIIKHPRKGRKYFAMPEDIESDEEMRQGVMVAYYTAKLGDGRFEWLHAPLLPSDLTGIAFDYRVSYHDGHASMTSLRTRHLVLVLNRLMWQKIAQVTPLRSPRAQARRAERMGRPPEWGQTWVMHLRRLAERIERDPDHVPLPANYDHRFLVRGHWRNQYYPSLNDHRLIWIDDYIKGPDDAPLVITDRLLSLDR